MDAEVREESLSLPQASSRPGQVLHHSPAIFNLDHWPSSHAVSRTLARQYTAMINAVLVFNNAGQPRLTKFYTQLVYLSASHKSALYSHQPGNQRAAAPHLGDLHSCRQPPQLCM